jgi:hypothetical protein
MAKKIIPFLNMINDKRVVVDMQIDEQRNILYVLYSDIKVKEADTFGSHLLGLSSIDVYDLGPLSHNFTFVTKITQK